MIPPMSSNSEERARQETAEQLDADLLTRLVGTVLNRSLPPMGSAEMPTLVEPDETPGTSGSGVLPHSMENRQGLVLLRLPGESDGVIGQGGQAIVYSYVQRELGREVAVKTLRPEHVSIAGVESLVREACVTARLEHPNIVPVHYLHLPEHDGDAPYWVMKRIRGHALTMHLPDAGDPWPVGRLLDVFRRIVDAVAFAHSKGIVHRDLKPDNVLVGEFGEVQVTDYGLAIAVTEEGAQGSRPSMDTTAAPEAPTSDQGRLSPEIARLNRQALSGSVGAPLRSRAAGRAGTPTFMAPEQLDITAERIDERTDVFLLGGVLYAMLTGQPPHQLTTGEGREPSQARLEDIRTCRTIVSPEERRQACGMAREVEGLSSVRMDGLCAIVMKALSVEPDERHQRVEDLVEELDRWEARSESQELCAEARTRWDQARAARRQQPRTYAEVIALADASVEKWPENAEAQQLREDASAALAAIQHRSIRRLWAAAAAIVLVFIVGAIGYQRTRAERDRTREQRDVADVQRRKAERLAEIEAEQRKTLAQRVDDAYHEAFDKFRLRNDPVGQFLVAVAARKHALDNGIPTAASWGYAGRQALDACPLLAGSTPLTYLWPCLSISVDGSTLAAGSDAGIVKVWDLSSGLERLSIHAHTQSVRGVALSPDARLLASCCVDRTVKLWDVSTGRERAVLRFHRNRVDAVAFSPDGRTLASASSDLTIVLWDVATQSVRATLKGHTDVPVGIAFSPDGRTLASAGCDHTVRLWDVVEAGARAVLRVRSRVVTPVAFGPDGRTLASGADDGDINLWKMPSATEIRTIKSGIRRLRALAFAPDGKTLAAGGAHGWVKLWDVALGKTQGALKGHIDRITDLAFTPDGNTIVTAACDTTLRLWDVVSRRERARLGGPLVGTRCFVLSPDGRTIAAAEYSGAIGLWDMASGRAKATLEGHSCAVISLAFSPDGKWLASGGKGHCEIKLWDLATRQPATTLKGHTGHVASLAFSRDSRMLASTDAKDFTVRTWAIPSGQGKLTLKGHTGLVRTVAFSSDGKTLFSCGDEAWVMVWDLATGKQKAKLTGHTDCIRHLVVSRDGRTLVSASADHTVRLWSLSALRCESTLKGHPAGLIAVALSSDGNVVASGGEGHTIRLWDVATKSMTATLRADQSIVQDLALDPADHTLISSSNDHTLKLWDMTHRRRRTVLTRLSDPFLDAAFSPDGGLLASGDSDGTVCVWDRATGRCLTSLKAHTDYVCSVAFSPDGRVLASGSKDHKIRLWDMAKVLALDASGRGPDASLATLDGHKARVERITFSPDGTLLASASYDRTARLWDVAAGAGKSTLEGHRKEVRCVSFSPDGQTLASGGTAGIVRLWDVASGKKKDVLYCHKDSILALRFSPDGRILATGSRDRTVRLLDLSSRQPLAQMRSHSNTVGDVAFSPDGAMLASSSLDHTVKLWDVASQELRVTLRGHSHWVNSVAFSPDGKTVASASVDGTIILWDVTPVPPMTAEEASRLVGSRLEGFETAPLPLHTYDARTRFVPRNGFAFAEPAGPQAEPNPYLQMRWSETHPYHWLPRAEAGDVEAMYRLAIIREIEGNDEEAKELHKKVAASTEPAQAEWAAKSRRRLKTVPWLRT